MKKYIFSLIFSIVVLAGHFTSARAQARISTRKVLVSDFTSRTTKVVLGGDLMLDALLKQEISERWKVSPYEFCTLEEYEGIKNNPQFYFLMFAYSTDAKGRRTGVTMLNLSKGGIEKPDKESNATKAFTLCNFPITSTRFPNGRESVWMAAAVDIIQTFALKAAKSDFSGYGGLKSMSSPLKCRNSLIYISEEDISPRLAEEIRAKYFDAKIDVMEDCDNILDEGTLDALVSFVVSPTEPSKGSPCFKMLVNAKTHELVYFDQTRISSRKPAGFNNNDIKKIGIVRKVVGK